MAKRVRRKRSARKNVSAGLLSFVAWFTGIVVSLAVGFGLVARTLILPAWLGGSTAVGLGITQVVGWIVIVSTLLGVLLAATRK